MADASFVFPIINLTPEILLKDIEPLLVDSWNLKKYYLPNGSPVPTYIGSRAVIGVVGGGQSRSILFKISERLVQSQWRLVGSINSLENDILFTALPPQTSVRNILAAPELIGIIAETRMAFSPVGDESVPANLDTWTFWHDLANEISPEFSFRSNTFTLPALKTSEDQEKVLDFARKYGRPPVIFSKENTGKIPATLVKEPLDGEFSKGTPITMHFAGGALPVPVMHYKAAQDLRGLFVGPSQSQNRSKATLGTFTLHVPNHGEFPVSDGNLQRSVAWINQLMLRCTQREDQLKTVFRLLEVGCIELETKPNPVVAALLAKIAVGYKSGSEGWARVWEQGAQFLDISFVRMGRTPEIPGGEYVIGVRDRFGSFKVPIMPYVMEGLNSLKRSNFMKMLDRESKSGSSLVARLCGQESPSTDLSR